MDALRGFLDRHMLAAIIEPGVCVSALIAGFWRFLPLRASLIFLRVELTQL
jgi:hypothetical protein